MSAIRAIRSASRCTSQLMALTSEAVQNSARVVSTSPRKDQSAMTLTFEEAVASKGCPFRKTMEPCVEPEVPSIKPFSAVPGPKGLPFVGTLLQYFTKDGPKFSKMFEVQQQRMKDFGDIYTEQLGDFQTVIVSSPWEYNKLVRAEGKFPNRKPMDPISHYRLERDMGLGLVTAQGEEWYKQRTVVSKKMLKLSEVTKFADNMAEVADDLASRIGSIRDTTGEVPKLEGELFKWAMESIGTFLFEERLGCLGERPSSMTQSFIENLEGFFKVLQPLLYNLPVYKLYHTKTYRKFEGHSDKLFEIGHTLVKKKMNEMQEKGSRSDFLQYLLDNGNMDSSEVTSVAVEMLMGAVETVTTTTTWCLYTLAQNPRAQAKMYEEIRAARAKNDGQLSAQDIASLPYVKAVVKETLRKYPITYATSRYIQEDLEIAGYNVPAGSHVQANLYGMYNNPDLFYRPKDFLPERWLQKQSKNMDPIVKSLSQLVWGHGARMCIGRRIAEQEMHLALTKIVENYNLSYHHEDVEPVLNTVMTPDRPVRIRFTPRDN